MVLVAFIVAACGHKVQDDRAVALTTYAEAMKLHDEVMPLMDEIYRLERRLTALKDSLQTDSVANAQRLSTVRTAVAALQKANKDMMDWMHNIQDVPGVEKAHGEHHAHHQTEPEEDNNATVLKVQQEQKARIEAIKVSMETSISEAKAIITQQ